MNESMFLSICLIVSCILSGIFLNNSIAHRKALEKEKEKNKGYQDNLDSLAQVKIERDRVNTLLNIYHGSIIDILRKHSNELAISKIRVDAPMKELHVRLKKRIDSVLVILHDLPNPGTVKTVDYVFYRDELKEIFKTLEFIKEHERGLSTDEVIQNLNSSPVPKE